MSDRDLVSYVAASIPLAIAHLTIPPLSSLALIPEQPPEALAPLFDGIYSLTPAIFHDSRFIRSLMYEQRKGGAFDTPQLDERLLTHLFVHSTYNHLLGNLIQCLLVGYPAFRHFGQYGFYLLFLTGGVVGSINAQILFANYLHKISPFSTQNTSQVGLFGLPSFRSLLTRVSSALGLEPRFLCCGSSGAVFTLYGCSLVLKLHTLLQDLFALSLQRKEGMGKVLGGGVGRLLLDLPYFFSFSAILAQELVGAEQQLQVQSDIISFFSARAVTGHQAHLQGLVFGVLVTLLSFLPRPFP